MGDNTHAGSFGETSIGLYADDTVGDLSASVLTDVLFEIGNGTATNARSNAMTVLKNGRVGIGTSAPSAKLDVNGYGHMERLILDGSMDQIQFEHPGEKRYYFMSKTKADNKAFALYSPDELGWLTYWKEGTGDMIDENGNVGIGTSTPGSKLHVNGSGGGAVVRVEAGGTDNWAEIDLKSSYNVANQGYWNISAKGSNGKFQIRNFNDARTVENVPLTITENGNVGIGTRYAPGNAGDHAHRHYRKFISKYWQCRLAGNNRITYISHG